MHQYFFLISVSVYWARHSVYNDLVVIGVQATSMMYSLLSLSVAAVGTQSISRLPLLFAKNWQRVE